MLRANSLKRLSEGSKLNFLGAITQLADFVVKALQSYATTAEGQQELADILQALDGEPVETSSAVPPTSLATTLEEFRKRYVR